MPTPDVAANRLQPKYGQLMTLDTQRGRIRRSLTQKVLRTFVRILLAQVRGTARRNGTPQQPKPSLVFSTMHTG
jgi:hypothetical protein